MSVCILEGLHGRDEIDALIKSLSGDQQIDVRILKHTNYCQISFTEVPSKFVGLKVHDIHKDRIGVIVRDWAHENGFSLVKVKFDTHPFKAEIPVNVIGSPASHLKWVGTPPEIKKSEFVKPQIEETHKKGAID